jgi:hypothetical protein
MAAEEQHERNLLPPGEAVEASRARGFVGVLSWMGAEAKHLEKICDWWRSLGFEALPLIIGPAHLLCPYWGGKLAGADFADNLKIAAAKEQQAPIFFHVFSGGSAILAHVFRRMEESERGRIAGCVLDSCPGAWNVQTAVDGMLGVFREHPTVRDALVGPVAKGVVTVWALTFEKEWEDEFQALMLANSPAWKVFQSRQDFFVNPAQLKALIELKRGTGAAVSETWFDTGRHAALFQDQKDEYLVHLEAWIVTEERRWKDSYKAIS